MVKKQSAKIRLYQKGKIMKHWLIILTICIFAQVISAQEKKSSSANSGSAGNFGLGITLFGPTGITGKYQLDEKLSIEGSLGFGSFGNGRFHLHGVLLYNFYQINESLSLYGGGGVVMQERGYKDGNGIGNGRGRGNIIHFFNNDKGYENSLGIRAPIGISWKNADKRFELSAEVYLHWFLTGRDGSDLGLALAGRYYF